MGPRLLCRTIKKRPRPLNEMLFTRCQASNSLAAAQNCLLTRGRWLRRSLLDVNENTRASNGNGNFMNGNVWKIKKINLCTLRRLKCCHTKCLILLLLCFLLFGDFFKLKKKLIKISKQVNSYFSKNNRKKGIWTPDLWFWKPLFYLWTIFLKNIIWIFINIILK